MERVLEYAIWMSYLFIWNDDIYKLSSMNRIAIQCLLILIMVGVVVCQSNITASSCPQECNCVGQGTIGCL
jgi:hypothetical protein